MLSISRETRERNFDGKMRKFIAAPLSHCAMRIWDDMSRFAVVLARPMIGRLGIVSSRVCLAWIIAGSGIVAHSPGSHAICSRRRTSPP